MIGPVQSRCHEGSPVGKRSLRWEGFVEKVFFDLEWKSEGMMDDESGDDNRDELTSEWGGESRHDWRGYSTEQNYIQLSLNLASNALTSNDQGPDSQKFLCQT